MTRSLMVLLALTFAGCSSLPSGAGGSSMRSAPGACSYPGAAPECRGLHSG